MNRDFDTAYNDIVLPKLNNIERSNSLNERSCWVCFGTETDEPGLEWISPCMCRGATKWVHQLCLQQWVDEKQRGSSSVGVSCPQCRFGYYIKYPDTSNLLYIYEFANKAITACSPMILAGVTASSLYWISFTYGYTAAAVALGRERFVDFSRSPESSVALLILPILPWAVLGLKLLRLEVLFLKAWYRIIPVVYALMEKRPSRTSIADDSIQDFRFIPAIVPVVPFLSRSILSTFFLPFIASSVGWSLSYVLRFTNTLKRTLLGGFGYLFISYALKICIEHHRGRLERRR